MTTVPYTLTGGFLSAPQFPENDYSLHLRDRMTQHEVTQCFQGFNQILRKQWIPTWWIFPIIILMILLWVPYVIIMVSYEEGFSWSLWLTVFLVQYIPLIIYFVVRGKRLKKLKVLLEDHAQFLNRQYNNRGINFRIATCYWGSNSNHANGMGRNIYQVLIEVGAPNTVPSTFQHMPAPEYQTYYPQPPAYQTPQAPLLSTQSIV